VPVSFGDTRVLCTASVETSSRLLARQGPGLVTAEYGMSRAPPHPRQPRGAKEAIGPDAGKSAADRALAARGVDLPKLGDASHRRLDVIQPMADAHGSDFRAVGSLCDSGRKAAERKALSADPIRTQWRSDCGSIWQCGVDLDMTRIEPPAATAIRTDTDGAIVEAQLTAEGEISDEEGLCDFCAARIGCSEIFQAQ